MTDDLISTTLKQFITSKVRTVAELEALMLMRLNPSKAWQPSALAERLYVRERDAALTLQRLEQEELITKVGDNAFRYYSDSQQAHLVDAAATAYQRCLVPLTNLIHSVNGHEVRKG